MSITTSKLTAVKTTTDLPEGSNLYFTDERAQDAVGAALTDTASVDFTYNDAGNTISAAVLPAGVDHNSLSNFVANKHIDHTTVSVTTAAGSGLSGGGDISATRTLVVDITGQTEDAVPDVADEIMVYDVSGAVRRKTKIQDFKWNSGDIHSQNHWEFLESTVALAGWTATNSGTGAAAATVTTGIDSTENCAGVAQMSTGTTATGRSSIVLDSANLLLGIFDTRCRFRLQVDTLSTVTETFTAYVGLIDVPGAGDNTDGAYFRYTNVGATPNWVCVTRSNSTETATTTSTAAVTTFEIFEVRVNQAGTSATFYINGALVATHTTNIPTAANRFTGVGAKIEKSLGVTARQIRVDYCSMLLARSGAR
jgi:hypothetical protein